MSTPVLDEARVKALVKEAVLEVLDERRDLLAGVIEEVIEDIGMLRAIEEGESTPEVPKEKVLAALEETP